MRHRVPLLVQAALLAVPLSTCALAYAQSPQADAPAPAVSLLNRCNQGEQNVWPTVEAYAALKGYPPAAAAMDAYRYLLLRILDMCNDGDTLVLGDRVGDSSPVFRRLISEFCTAEDVKSAPIVGVDPVRNPNAVTLSCKVTKIDALKGRPVGSPPASMTSTLPLPADPNP
jgi:hypothetical protein